jgi:eukaryotic-like serine/threonine-protein kinase
MPLLANARLGHYEIKSALGVGGMGEVYRAWDRHLNRDVAIKVLHEHGANSDDQRIRFEREARAVAALNHPNIVVVHDFGVQAGQQYIVSELIEGESLRSLLGGKPVPARKLLDIATQVADGLAAAHAAGIVHRDLKPENIMLTREGRVKILDFGLARHTPTSSGAAAGEVAATSAPDADETKHLTHEGTVIGTASYMSPEQALGKAVDFRTDQFSFGLILYELASGKRAFARDSLVETMAAIVRDDAPPIQEKLPAPMKWIVDRCLAKEPEQRYESTRDLFRDLRNLRDHFSEVHTSGALAPIPPPKKRGRWRTPALCAGFMLLAGLVGYLLKPAGQDIGNYRYTPISTGAENPVWSPDGKAFAYAGAVNGTEQVFLHYLNSPVPIQLTHETGGVWPLGWSSDRSHLIVFQRAENNGPADLRLSSVATVGGDLEFIMYFDCDWACGVSRDGKALATFMRGKEGKYVVEMSDPLGSPLRVYMPAPFTRKDNYNHPQLEFSPDGKEILLFRTGDGGKDEAWLLPYPAGGEPPRRILQKLHFFGTTPSFSWLPDNRHIVVTLAADQDSPSRMWIADTASNDLTPLTTGTSAEHYPAVSPDGKSILYDQDAGRYDLVSVSIEDGAAKTLITTGHDELMAAWCPSQAKLAWVTNRSGSFEIWIRSPDGSDRPAVTAADFPARTTTFFMDPSLSRDGNRLIFARIDNLEVSRLWISSLSGGAPVRLTNAGSDLSGEFGGSWSPDGSRFVYQELQAGKLSLMMVKTSGNVAPIVLRQNVFQALSDWSPLGDWITYQDEKGWSLISPDGKTSKFLGKIDTASLAFSKDGKLLYGIRTGETEADKDRASLFSLDPATLRQKTIKELGKDLQPGARLNPGIRFSLAPDGKSFVYSTAHPRLDLWMLQGYRQPGWLSRLSDALR